VSPDVLTAKRVLFVEDEMLVAMLIEDALTDLGCTIVGPATSVDRALALLEAGGIDLAILDVNLNGTRTDAVAAELRRKRIPFVFATGYGTAASADLCQGQLVLPKPFSTAELASALVEVWTRSRRPA
jgi:CheY-like chemotaxis protein